MIVTVYAYDERTGAEAPAQEGNLADLVDREHYHRAVGYLTQWGRYWVDAQTLLMPRRKR